VATPPPRGSKKGADRRNTKAPKAPPQPSHPHPDAPKLPLSPAVSPDPVPANQSNRQVSPAARPVHKHKHNQTAEDCNTQPSPPIESPVGQQ
jgi:hypothetical protein